MHIDEAVLNEVMEAYGFESKTDAVNTALREMVRHRKLREMGETGLGLTMDELIGAVDPDYDVMAMRVAEPRTEYGHGRRDDSSSS